MDFKGWVGIWKLGGSIVGKGNVKGKGLRWV